MPASASAPTPAPSGGPQAGTSGRLRVLVVLVCVEAALMLLTGVAFLVYVLLEGQTGYQHRSQALSGALVLLATMAIWGIGLLTTARAAAQGRRWSFSVILFTQMMWGFIFASSLGNSGGAFRVALVALLALVIATVAVLFHPEVRALLGRGPRPRPAPRA